MKNEGHGFYDDEASDYGTQPLRRTDTDKPKEQVDHPEHYSFGGLEVIEMMVQCFGWGAVMEFCYMNAFKYRMRAGKKGDAMQDIRKAEWYEDYAKKLLQRQEEKQR